MGNSLYVAYIDGSLTTVKKWLCVSSLSFIYLLNKNKSVICWSFSHRMTRSTKFLCYSPILIICYWSWLSWHHHHSSCVAWDTNGVLICTTSYVISLLRPMVFDNVIGQLELTPECCSYVSQSLIRFHAQSLSSHTHAHHAGLIWNQLLGCWKRSQIGIFPSCHRL